MEEGRDFSRQISTDTASFLINEEAAKLMGLQNPVGTKMKFWEKEGRIIGVVKDFHFATLHSGIGPMILRFWPENTSYCFAKITPNETEAALASLQRVYEKYEADYPFEYHFLDQDFEKLYKSEKVISGLGNLFSILAIIISCLGLYGLVAFATARKTKEIGIRKVLGASVKSILLMLSSDFMKWIIIANILAWPVALYLMNEWLDNFAYRIDVGWEFFVLAGFTTLIISLVTLSFRSVRAALANPVDSLRYE